MRHIPISVLTVSEYKSYCNSALDIYFHHWNIVMLEIESSTEGLILSPAY